MNVCCTLFELAANVPVCCRSLLYFSKGRKATQWKITATHKIIMLKYLLFGFLLLSLCCSKFSSVIAENINSTQNKPSLTGESFEHSFVAGTILSRKCIKCGNDKPLSEFNKCKRHKDKLYSYCKACAKLVGKEHRNKNKESIKERKHNWYKANKDRVTKQHKEWRNNNNNKYLRERRKRDINFKIRDNLTTRIWFALKGSIKSEGTIELLGCSIEYLKSHLESKFTEGMNWGNYGKFGWHVDHIKACSKFDLSSRDEQLKCFNYTNLQPLWWYDNIEKSNK